MNKLFTSIAVASLSLTMAVGVGVAVNHSYDASTKVNAASSVSGIYNLVTSTSGIAAGDTVILVNHNGTKALTGISTTNTKYGTLADVTKTNDSITLSNADVEELTVEAGDSTGQFRFKGTADISNYLYWTSGNSLNQSATKDAKTSWTLNSYSSGSGMTIANCSDATRIIRFNSDRFACYTSNTGTLVDLYKKSSTPVTKYTVSFNSNGGSGSMSDVSDVLGSYTLPSNGFTAPSGMAFAGWKANNTGDTIAAGGSYTVSADVTFYAQWAAQRTLTYDANGGSGTMVDPNSPYGDGATVTVLANSFTAPTGKRFVHWNTASDDSGIEFDASDTFTISLNTTLYAIWEDAPSEVNITYSSYSGNLPASGYSAVDWTADGISGKIYSIKHSSSAVQFQANTSYIYNSDAISGYIKKITISKYSGSFSQLTAFVGDDVITEKPSSGGINNNTDWVWNFDVDDQYTFFRIDSTSTGAKYFNSIVVEYEKVAQVDPSGIVLDDESSISMDTYGYGSRTLVATVEPFNANDKTVTWGTNNSSVVTVSNGVLTPIGVGTTSVYAQTSNFVSVESTPELRVSVNVTVVQAQYKKATFVPTSVSAANQTDDYLPGGSVAVSSTNSGTFVNDKSAIQLTSGKDSVFTITGYAGMKITGIDLVMSSNGNAGTGSLTVTAGSTTIHEIETAPFNDPSWNSAFDANPCHLYKDSTDYVIQSSEEIVFTFTSTVNSLYIYSVSIRYLDYSLEEWCSSFLTTLKGGSDPICVAVGTTDTTELRNAWDDLGIAFLYDVSDDVKTIAANATADENGTIIEQAVYLYDWCVTHYDSTICDRFISGRASNNSVVINHSLFNSINSQATTAIIVVVALTSVTAIGAIFFIKRRKYN